MIETSYRPLEQFKAEALKLFQEVKPLLTRSVAYEGRFDDGKKSGKGDFVYPNLDYYQGNFDRDNREGFGTLVSFKNHYVYKGEFKADQIKGSGICLFSNGMVIEGYFNGVSTGSLILIGTKTSDRV